MPVNTERDISKQVDKCFTYRESRSCNYRVKLFISGIALWHVYIRHETWFRQDRVYYHICSINVQIGKTVVAITAYFIIILNPVFFGFSLVEKGKIWGNNFPMSFNLISFY